MCRLLRALALLASLFWYGASHAQAPFCDTGGPYAGSVGEPITFDGSESTAVPGQFIVTYEWEFGDGAVGEGAIVDHTYSNAANYLVTLTVWDDAGLASACVTDVPVTPAVAVERETWGYIKALYGVVLLP